MSEIPKSLQDRAYYYGVMPSDGINQGIEKLLSVIDRLDNENKMLAGPIVGTTRMRQFETGATRSPEAGKLDYAGFFSPFAMERFAKYMQTHQVQEDGKPRASNNWKKGIPLDSYRRSLMRHMVDFAKAYESEDDAKCQELLCAIWFNVQGYLHERVKPDFSKTVKFTEGDSQPKPAPKSLGGDGMMHLKGDLNWVPKLGAWADEADNLYVSLYEYVPENYYKDKVVMSKGGQEMWLLAPVTSAPTVNEPGDDEWLDRYGVPTL